jgi:pimeloyl-ACP methyl ester carboxylesterase
MSVPRINGVQLSDPGAGPPLLLGTSIGTSGTALWSASAAFLGERFHVVAWDLPGQGRPSTSSGNTKPVYLVSRWRSSPPACWHSPIGC